MVFCQFASSKVKIHPNGKEIEKYTKQVPAHAHVSMHQTYIHESNVNWLQHIEILSIYRNSFGWKWNLKLAPCRCNRKHAAMNTMNRQIQTGERWKVKKEEGLIWGGGGGYCSFENNFVTYNCTGFTNGEIPGTFVHSHRAQIHNLQHRKTKHCNTSLIEQSSFLNELASLKSNLHNSKIRVR